jgi:hypothetical protein
MFPEKSDQASALAASDCLLPLRVLVNTGSRCYAAAAENDLAWFVKPSGIEGERFEK